MPVPTVGDQKKVVNVVNAVIVSVPPSQIGFEIQYMTALTEAMGRPRASFVQMYAPPSSRKVEPSSAVSMAYGRKKNTPRKISQRNAWAP